MDECFGMMRSIALPMDSDYILVTVVSDLSAVTKVALMRQNVEFVRVKIGGVNVNGACMGCVQLRER